MAINYEEEKAKAIKAGKRTLKIYPPILFSKRNRNSSFSIKIFDIEMMRDILAENFYLNDVGIGNLAIDFQINPDTKKVYSYIDTRNLQYVYGQENPNFYLLTAEQRKRILDEQAEYREERRRRS